uniref:Uncharacterized protein n=1 Tax=Oryza meridionalis TaxID=40149 RepID=A0A0E0CTV6_9ORYZ
MLTSSSSNSNSLTLSYSLSSPRSHPRKELDGEDSGQFCVTPMLWDGRSSGTSRFIRLSPRIRGRSMPTAS